MKKSILTSIIAVAMCAGVYLTNGQQSDQSALTLDGVEAVADVEGPEVTITCDTDPTSMYARCWIAESDRDGTGHLVFRGCRFNGQEQSRCMGEKLPYIY